MLESKEFLSSTQYIQLRLKEEHRLEVQESRLVRIMHQEMGMRYKKVKPISW